jgi:hypothetical protein
MTKPTPTDPKAQVPADTQAPTTTTVNPRSKEKTMLVADVHLSKLDQDFMSRVANIKKNVKIKDKMAFFINTDAKHLIRASRHELDKLHIPYVLYTIDVTTDSGYAEFQAVLLTGRMFAEVEGEFECRKWFVSSMIPQKDRITFIMTLKSDANLWERCGLKVSEKGLKSVGKRLRRILSNAKYLAEGTILQRIHGLDYYFEKNGQEYTLPMTDYVVRFTHIFKNGVREVLRRPITLVIGYVHLDNGLTSQQVTSISDGLQWGDADSVSTLFGENYEKGDGVRFTGLFDLGGAKGHMVMAETGYHAAILFDAKPEVARIGDSFTFSIMQDLHRPRTARLDVQSVINGQLAEGGFLLEAGLAHLARVNAMIGDDQLLIDMIGDLYKDEAVEERGEDDDTPKKPWLLAQFVHDMKDGGTSIWRNNPCLARRAFEHIIAQTLDINKCRIALPQEVAVRGYVMPDISICEHPDPTRNGCGIYLSQAVLSYTDAVIFSSSRDALGLTHNVMCDGDAITWRQPNGWGGEMFRHLHLVRHDFYCLMEKSPFLFVSTGTLDIVDGEFGAYVKHVLAPDVYQKLIDVWGQYVPCIALINAMCGGGDNDDLHFVVRDERWVSYLQSQVYSVLDFPLTPVTVVTEEVTPENRHMAQHLARIAAHKQAKEKTYYSEIAEFGRAMNQGSRLGQAINVCMCYVAARNAGQPVSDAMVPFCRNQEGVIDGNIMNKGSEIGDLPTAVATFTKSVTEMSEFLITRLPKLQREHVKPVKWAIDNAMDVLANDLKGLRKAAALYYHPDVVERVPELMNYPVSSFARAVSQDWRQMWGKTMRAERKILEAFYETNQQFSLALDKDKAVTVESCQLADEYAWQAVGVPLQLGRSREAWQMLLIESMIGVYQHIFNPYRALTKGEIETGRLADAMLYGEHMGKIFRAAIQFALGFGQKSVEAKAEIIDGRDFSVVEVTTVEEAIIEDEKEKVEQAMVEHSLASLDPQIVESVPSFIEFHEPAVEPVIGAPQSWALDVHETLIQ